MAGSGEDMAGDPRMAPARTAAALPPDVCISVRTDRGLQHTQKAASTSAEAANSRAYAGISIGESGW